MVRRYSYGSPPPDFKFNPTRIFSTPAKALYSMQRGWAVKWVIVFTSVLKIDSVVSHLQNDLRWDFREQLPPGASLESLLLEMLQGFSHCPSSSLTLPRALSYVLPLFSSFLSVSLCPRLLRVPSALLALPPPHSLSPSLSLSFSLWRGVQGILGRHPICRQCVVIAFCWWCKKINK